MEENNKIEILERALQRQKEARKAAESILEEKSRELYLVSQELKLTNVQLEDLLSEKTSELEGVFLNIIDAYVVMDLYGNVLKMNEAAIKMLGFDLNIEPINLTNLVKPEYVEYTANVFKELYNKGSYNKYQAVILTKKNEEKLVQINSSIIYNKAGKPIAAQGILRDITQENANIELMEEQKKQLNIIVDNSPIGISLYKVGEKGLLTVNKKLCEMLGYSAEEFSNMQVQDLTHPDDVEISKSNRNKLMNEELETFTIEKRYIRKDGKIVWAKTSVTAVKDITDNIKFQVGLFEDITKEKEAKIKLKESENRLSTLIGNLQTGILLEDEFENIQVVNKKFREIFNVNNDTCLLDGKNISHFHNFLNDFLRNSEEFELTNSALVGDYDSVENQELEMLDGRVIERNGIPIIQDGLYKGYLWSFYDITLNKRYKESLEAQKEKYSNIITNMNLGLIEVNTADKILFANQMFCEISGYTIDELIGQNAADLMLQQESRESFKAHKSKRFDGISDSYEVKARTKSGEIRDWLISGAPNYHNGKIIGSIGIHLDITDQKNLEKQKEHLLENLERQNEQLNEYAHMVSHDLKSPLRSISALLSWTKEDFRDKLGEESLFNLNLMDEKVEKMDTLITDILNYSSISEETIINKNVDLNQVINNLLGSIFIPAHIEIKILQKLPNLNADPTRLQQLFQNLIGNAVIYIDKEKGLVEIDYTENDDYFIFSIKDNGPGIAPEYHEKIFKMFNSLGSNKHSSGIGLSIVRKVIELYKGKIWLESEVGVGTTFFFSIKKL